MTMTPREYSFATVEALGNESRYRHFCERARLDPRAEGWGLLHCEDHDGERWTLAGDPEYMRTLVAGQDAGRLVELQVPRDRFPVKREGWPDEW